MHNWSAMPLAVSLVFLLVPVACVPKTAPVSAPASVAPAVQATATASVVASKLETDEDVAWRKVVEAAKKEGKVNVYSFNWVGDIELAVKKAFENRYNINLDIITGRGAEFVERLKTERRLGQRTGDIAEGSAAEANNMKEGGLLTPVAAELPALRQKDVWWFHPTYLDPVDKAVLIYTQQMNTPAINTNLVKPGEEPTSWKDLLDPKWRGKVSLREPRLNAVLIVSFVALLDKNVWNENDIRALHKQEPKYVISSIEEIRMLSKGEFNMSALGSGNGMTRFAAEGAPIRALTMKEGELVSTRSVAAIANAPHPNATKVLLNWLLSPEGQSVSGKALSSITVRKDVPDFQPQAAQTKMVNPIMLTQEYYDEGTKRYLDKWYDKLVGR